MKMITGSNQKFIFLNNIAAIICLVTFFFFLLSYVVIHTRPLLPIIETRYTSIAWEMWINHQYIFPLQNGLPYSDKPPFLFWIILAGWHLWGVNEWWPRIIPTIFAFFDAILLSTIAGLLWPQRKEIHLSCFILLLGSFAFIIYANLVLFDLILIFWLLIALYSLFKIYFEKNNYFWGSFALGVGLGLLTKGPIILPFILISSVLLPRFIPLEEKIKHYYWLLLISTLVGIAIVLSWAIPAAYLAGPAFAKSIFFSQSLGRIVPHHHLVHHAHFKSFFWYFKFLPFYLAPWFLFLPFYTQWKKLKIHNDKPLQFVITIILICFLMLCLIGGKQIHYLLPLLPFTILVIANLSNSNFDISSKSLWLFNLTFFLFGLFLCLPSLMNIFLGQTTELISIPPSTGYLIMGYGFILFFLECSDSVRAQLYMTLNSLILITFLYVYVIHVNYKAFDLKPLAEFISNLQQKNYPVGYLGEYQDQLHFMGKLLKPISSVEKNKITTWAKNNQNGWLILNPTQTTQYTRRLSSSGFVAATRCSHTQCMLRCEIEHAPRQLLEIRRVYNFFE